MSIFSWFKGSSGKIDNPLAEADDPTDPLAKTDDQVDPLAEAEVYLAYGRDKQAIEILETALRADPKDERIRKRLREIKAKT